jgi:preprotein translocase subunit SecD
MLRLFLVLLAVCAGLCDARAGSPQPKVTLRLHLEVGAQAAPSGTVMKVNLPNPPIPVFISKYADLSERNLVDARAYPAQPGAVLLQFDESGRRRLAALTGAGRGMKLVVFLNGTIVFCPEVDVTLPNGKLLIPSGISPANLTALQRVAKTNARK